MADLHEFKPSWTLAPAAILREWLDENGLTPGVLAVACGGKAHRATSLAHIEAVLDRQPFGELTAMVLCEGTGVPAKFWLGLEASYRAGLAAGLTDATPEDGDG